MIAARIWNLVLSNLLGMRRLCPQCGRLMRRIIAVDESYVRERASYGASSRGASALGGQHIAHGLKMVRRVRITPRYDICEDCDQRIRHRNIKLRIS